MGTYLPRYPLRSNVQDLVLIFGHLGFQTGGAAAVQAGKGFTSSTSGGNEMRELSGGFQSLLCAVGLLNTPTNDSRLVYGRMINTTQKEQRFRVCNNAGADQANDAGVSSISFILATSLQRRGIL